MADMVLFFDALWGLIWFPLEHLSLESRLLSYPLLVLFLGALFGLLFRTLRGVAR